MGGCNCTSAGSRATAVDGEATHKFTSSTSALPISRSARTTSYLLRQQTCKVEKGYASSLKPRLPPEDCFTPAIHLESEAESKDRRSSSRSSNIRKGRKSLSTVEKKMDPIDTSFEASTASFASGGALTDMESSAEFHTSMESSLDFLASRDPGLEDEDLDVLPDYSCPRFWQEVYSGTSKWQHTIPEEWLMNYEYFKKQRWHRYLRGGKVLELGCGNSLFMSDAYDDGIQDVTCTDIDAGVIEEMRKFNQDLRPQMKYMQSDVRKMRGIPSKSFDIVVDKSTMDALLCAGKAMTTRASGEIHRILKDAGLYLCISFAHPDQMVEAIAWTGQASCQWQIQVLSCEPEFGGVDECQNVYMYVCRKVQALVPRFDSFSMP